MRSPESHSSPRATDPASPGMQHYSVREGRLAPVTCVACGCRLWEGADGAWMHFAGVAGRDARGCTVPCVAEPHYATSVGDLGPFEGWASA